MSCEIACSSSVKELWTIGIHCFIRTRLSTLTITSSLLRSGVPQRQLIFTHGSSQTLDQQLGSLHGTGLGPLHVCDYCVTWCHCRDPTSEINIYPWSLAALWDLFPMGITLSSPDARQGAQSFAQSHWSLSPF